MLGLNEGTVLGLSLGASEGPPVGANVLNSPHTLAAAATKKSQDEFNMSTL